jgi:hypothetical protein
MPVSSSPETTPLILSEWSEPEGKRPKVRRGKRRRHAMRLSLRFDSGAMSAPSDRLSSDATENEVPIVETKLQNLIYFGHILATVGHFIVTLYLMGRHPEVQRILIFHGIISPVHFILYGLGFMSAIYGYLGMYRHKDGITLQRRAQWYRRYMRSNKYFALVWVFATLYSIFGCWQFLYAQTLDEEYPTQEILKSPEYQPIIKQIIFGLPYLMIRLRKEFGITNETPPLNMVGLMGKYYLAAGVFFTALPLALMITSLHWQRRYYAMRFIN